MKNKKFFYLQYDKISWQNQEKTKINSFVNNFIIKNIISKKNDKDIKIFDIGFGIGFFIEMLQHRLKDKNLFIEGCEPSEKNYVYFLKKKLKVKSHNTTFQKVNSKEEFDFITAIYVFPHFSTGDLRIVLKKINNLLKKDGKFILVVAEEKYLKEKLKSKRDLFIEENSISFAGKKYKEFLHYSDIPEIGKIIDYNREESFYIDLFKKNGFVLDLKKNLNDNGFICTVFSFKKK